MSTPNQILDSLRSKHPRHLEYEIKGHGTVMFRAPTGAEFDRFIDQVSGDKVAKSSAMGVLVKACAVYPDADKLDAILDAFPALKLTATADLQELAGADSGAIVKKE